MSSEVDNAHAEDGINSQGEDGSGWDPYLVSAVNSSKQRGGKHLSESMSAVLNEMGDTTVRRRATLLRMARKN